MHSGLLADGKRGPTGAGEAVEVAATTRLRTEPNGTKGPAQTEGGGPWTDSICELAPTLWCNRHPREISFPVEGAHTLSTFLFFFCHIPPLNYVSHFTEQKLSAYYVPAKSGRSPPSKLICLPFLSPVSKAPTKLNRKVLGDFT